LIGCVSAWWGLVSLGLVRQGRHGRASCGSSGCGVLCHRRFGRVRFRLVWLGWAGTVWQVRACHGEASLGLERSGRLGGFRQSMLRQGEVCHGQAGLVCCVSAWQVTVWSGRYGGSWQGRARYGLVGFGTAGVARRGMVGLGAVRHGRLKPERRKSEVGRHKQKAILIRHRQVQSVR